MEECLDKINMETMKILIISPTYNEREYYILGRTNFDVANLCLLIVDDKFPDGTANQVIELKESILIFI